MSTSRKRAGSVGLAGLVGLAVSLAAATPALADYGPQPGDIVGVGSDTVQNIGDFLTDGDPAQDAGYNSAGNVHRFVSFDATADANDRAAYGATGRTGGSLSPTIILRAGTHPVQRPNGSGSGVAAMVADTHSPEQINYVRSSSASAITGAASAAVPLHAIKIATDDLVIAAAKSATNAVPLTGAQLVQVYTCAVTDWHTLNPTAPAGSTIAPFYPQSGSGTGKTFLADLKTFNGGTAVTPGACATVVEENDPSVVAGQPNAIAPFSSGRIKLFDSGYFTDPTVAYPGSASGLTSGVTALYGSATSAQTAGACTAPSQANAATLTYCDTRGLYIAWRQADSTSTVPFQPGGTQNWVQTLFLSGSSSKPFVETAAGQADIAAAGATPLYVDCGITTGSAFTTC